MKDFECPPTPAEPIGLRMTDDGLSPLPAWSCSADELLTEFEKAEANGDDIRCLEILDEKRRRGLVVMDRQNKQITDP